MSTDYVIETVGLTKRFGRKTVVDRLHLQVPRGSVFAFLGRNGAGKTTTIRMLLNQLNRTSGEAWVLGKDAVKGSMEIRKRIGYVAQNEDLYDWMTVDEMIWFCKGFYPTWDEALTRELLAKLHLPGKTKIRNMSRGMQAQLALLLAFAYRPELLILDEPTAGLDVIVRREFLEGVIELAQEEGRTIFFSSHLVHEVERIADWVGIMEAGKMVFCAPIDDLKAQTKRIIAHFPTGIPKLAGIPGLLHTEQIGKKTILTVSTFNETTITALRAMTPTQLDVEDMSLEDIFVAYVGTREG